MEQSQQLKELLEQENKKKPAKKRTWKAGRKKQAGTKRKWAVVCTDNELQIVKAEKGKKYIGRFLLDFYLANRKIKS